MRMTVCLSIDAGARLCANRLIATGVALQVGEHPVGLGPGEVVDVHVDRSHVAMLDESLPHVLTRAGGSRTTSLLTTFPRASARARPVEGSHEPRPPRPQRCCRSRTVAAPGLTTYDAKDPDTSFPPIEPLLPPEGAPERAGDPARRRRLRRLERLRRPVPDAHRRAAGRRRPAVQPVPHDGAVRADAPGAADRAQPPLGGDGQHHRDRDVRARAAARCARTPRRRWR